MTGRRKRAEDGTRTRYLQLGKLSLYQVSYFRLILIMLPEFLPAAAKLRINRKRSVLSVIALSGSVPVNVNESIYARRFEYLCSISRRLSSGNEILKSTDHVQRPLPYKEITQYPKRNLYFL